MRNDIENINQGINIEEASKCHGNFVSFQKNDDQWDFSQIGLHRFHSKNLTCEKLTLRMKINSLRRMRDYLSKVIEKAVEDRLINIKEDLIEIYRKKNNLHLIEDRIVEILEEVNQGSSADS